jgi:hypothetical protein
MASTVNLGAAPARHDFADFSITLVAGLALAVTAIFLLAVPMAGKMTGSRDFVAYWATGQQLVHHANPYDHDAVGRIEHAAGLTVKGVLLMRNPPWALPLAYPLGFLGLRLAAILWSLVLVACLLVSVGLVRAMHGSPPGVVHWLGLAFTPALICLTMGQTSLFALLGLVLFLRLHHTRPFLAGASLWLCALKPHLFLPFAAALALWIVISRSYKVVAGAVAALAASCAIATLIDPASWTAYTAMMRAPNIEKEFIPCLSDALRIWIWPQATWLQFLPAALACLWAIWYFWTRRRTWNWVTNGSPLMLASIVAAPYCFLYDQGLAIPALLDGAYSTRARWLLTALAVVLLAIDAEVCKVEIVSALYLWTAPVWLGWYLLARAHARDTAAVATPQSVAL